MFLLRMRSLTPLTLGRQHARVCAGFVSKLCRSAPSLTEPSQPLATFDRNQLSQGGSPCATSRSSSRSSSRPFSSRRRLGRPDVGRIPRRPRLPLRPGSSDEIEMATATNNASILRTLVTWADVAPTKPANAADPFDPAYRFDDLDEFVRNAQARRGSSDHALGHAEVGERQQGPQLPADVDGRLPELREGSRLALLRPHGRLPVRPVLRDLERIEPRALPDGHSSTRRARSSAPPPMPSSPPPATPGSRPATRRRSSRSVRRRRTAATRRRRARATRCAGHVRPARREGEQEPQVRCLGPPPVSRAGEPEADAEGAVAERRPHLAAPVRDVARQVVRTEEHPDLDHRVRQRDEAGRAERRHGVAAGGLHDPGDRDREEGQARADVHLVRDAGLGRQPLAERGLPDRRAARSRRSRSSPQRRRHSAR